MRTIRTKFAVVLAALALMAFLPEAGAQARRSGKEKVSVTKPGPGGSSVSVNKARRQKPKQQPPKQQEPPKKQQPPKKQDARPGGQPGMKPGPDRPQMRPVDKPGRPSVKPPKPPKPSKHRPKPYYARPAFGTIFAANLMSDMAWTAVRMAVASNTLACSLNLTQTYAADGRQYYYQDGVFYVQERDGDFKVIVPPAGALVETLPDDCQIVMIAGKEYYKVDDTIYKVTVIDGQAYFEVVGQL